MYTEGEIKERNDKILSLRTEDGLTLQEIANRWGLSRERVRQILERQLGGGSGFIKKEREKGSCLWCRKEFTKRYKRQLSCSMFCRQQNKRNFPWVNNVPRCQKCGEEQKLYNNKYCRKCSTEKSRIWRNKPGNMKYVYENNKRNNKKNPEKMYARWYLNYKLKMGLVYKPSHCIKCSESKIYAHHPDYSKPLEVLWLCSNHHAEIHNRNKSK